MTAIKLDPSKNLHITELEKSDMAQLRQEAKQKILANPFAIKVIDEQHVPESALMSNLSEFLRLCEENEPCLTCKSLASCPKYMKGQQADLLHVGVNVIDLIYHACQFKQAYDKYAQYYVYHDFDDDWMQVRLDDLIINADRKCLIRGFTELLTGKCQSLYIFGKLGLGKSYTCVALCNEFAASLGKGKVAYVNTRKIAGTLRDMLFNKENDQFAAIMGQLKVVPLLVLDDIGSEKITDWSKEDFVYEVVVARQQKKLATIFTSDFSLAELQKLYDGKEKNDLKNERLFNVLRNYTKEIELLGLQVK